MFSMTSVRLVLILLFFLAVCPDSLAAKRSASLVRRLLMNYNEDEPPRLTASTPVKVGIYVNTMQVNDKTMEFTTTMYFRQSWNDPRLAFNATGIDKISASLWDKVWIPDTFFRNGKKSSFHGMTVDNRLLRIKRNGDVWYVIKMTGTFACPMKLQRYPFDTQFCSIIIESFGYKMDAMSLSTLETPIDVDNDLILIGFQLVKTSVHDCSQNYTTGAFPCVALSFVFRRSSSFLVLPVFFPSIIIVLLSLSSFWIRLESTTARLLVALMTALAIALMSAFSPMVAPPSSVSYMTLLDIWMICCSLFVYVAFILQLVALGHSKPAETCPNKDASGNGDQSVSKIDRVVKIVFPIVFVLFNLGFWLFIAV